jgi:hypothetical protein
MLIAVTAGCLVSGFLMNKLLRQRTAVRHFNSLTANRPDDGGTVIATMVYRVEGEYLVRPAISKWLAPFSEMIDEEAFGDIIGMQLLDSPTTDADLRYLRDLPQVQILLLSRTKMTDAGIPHLLACRQLRYLSLVKIPLSDEGIAQLTQLKQIETLTLDGTAITDASVEHLTKLPKLKWISILDTSITDEGYLRLQAALLECYIQSDVPAARNNPQPGAVPYW